MGGTHSGRVRIHYIRELIPHVPQLVASSGPGQCSQSEAVNYGTYTYRQIYLAT